MIEVAAGILADAKGRVLLMQRLPGKHLAGLWEFPGGKLEPNETILQALMRELDEELGITVLAAVPLISLPWYYPGKSVRLHAWRVTAWRGEPHAREGHPLRWAAVQGLDAGEMPPADVPMVTALRLPPHYAMTPRPPGGSNSSLSLPSQGPASEVAWQDTLVAPALWQLHAQGAPRDEIRRMARHALAAEPRLRGSMLVSHDVELARELGVGVHLAAAQLREWDARPLPRGRWVGASCHDAAELELAAGLGADFATLSPVCATTSHPDAEPLGWDRFAQLVAEARLPVYALGGVGPDDLERARAAGAQGVAGIRAFR